MNLPFENKIIDLKEVKECIEFAASSKNIVCIGVDGPTASGKTIFAQLLKDKINSISCKDVQIIPLDALLIERNSREKCLQNLQDINMPFEHEAEVHMRFSKFDELLNLITLKKVNSFDNGNIVLNNLYSRKDNGRCIGELKVNLNKNKVLIFEGHYTTRPEFSVVLDRNFILLANREELIKRKIDRVSSYRNKKQVEEYFNLIDEPSYLSNYFRFASEKSLIIDNTNLAKPFFTNYEHIFNLLNTNKFLEHNNITINKIKEFLFGLHGLSNYPENYLGSFEPLFEEFNQFKKSFSRSLVSNIFSKYEIKHDIVYFDYLGKNDFEAGIIVKLFEKNCTWILSKKNNLTKHLISWDGGIYKIEKGLIGKLAFLKNDIHVEKKNFWEELRDGNGFISSTLLNDNFKNDNHAYCFLENTSRISFLASTLRYTQIRCRSLGDFFMIAFKRNIEDKLEKFTTIPTSLKINEITFNDNKFYQKKTEFYFLTQDFLIMYKKLSMEIFYQLREIYFNSNDIRLRGVILKGFLHEDNKKFISEEIRNYVRFSICFFPSSMSRFYILRRMEIEEGNILATNIYDISYEPIDSSAYLEVAFEESLPTILQISLNASGQAEKTLTGSKVIGYLEPKDGINDFTNSISEKLVKILEDSSSQENAPPLIGIGLDHVDIRGDNPYGRSKRFLKNAIKTECITHITLDGSERFKPKEKIFPELFKAYEGVFKASIEFLDKSEINGIDLEFCTGELNYIGNDTNPHYPEGKEMALLPHCLNQALEEEKNMEYKTNLLNSIKLYVGNLGTCHHGLDKEDSLRIKLSGEWQESLMGTNFISPVLHGTTGSSDKTFLLASKSCHKINIAGSLLRVLLDNLSPKQKETIGFESFNEKSKLLCKNFSKLKNDKDIYDTRELKNVFVRYCKINNVKKIPKEHLKIIRKPFYGRNKISKHIFSKIEQMIN